VRGSEKGGSLGRGVSARANCEGRTAWTKKSERGIVGEKGEKGGKYDEYSGGKRLHLATAIDGKFSLRGGEGVDHYITLETNG